MRGRSLATTALRWLEGRLRDRGLVADGTLPDGPRVTTYNIGRGAKGGHGATSATLDRVAATIAVTRPDVVALQEVHEDDLPTLVRELRREHGLRYEARFLATVSAEGMDAVAHRARTRAVAQGRAFDEAHYRDRRSAYGIATLSLAPLTAVEEHRLGGGGEPRAALVARTDLRDHPVTVICTHLATRRTGTGGPGPSTRDLQTREVLALAAGLDGSVALAGDLNQEPAELAANLAAAGSDLVVANDPDDPTLGARVIDFVLTSPDLAVVGRRVGAPGPSDHRPVTVVLRPPA